MRGLDRVIFDVMEVVVGRVKDGVGWRVGVLQSLTYGTGDGSVGMQPYTVLDVLHTTSFT